MNIKNLLLDRTFFSMCCLLEREKGNYLKMRDYSSNGELQLQSSFCNWIPFLLFSFSEQNFKDLKVFGLLYWLVKSFFINLLFLCFSPSLHILTCVKCQSMPNTFIIPDRKFVLDHQYHKSCKNDWIIYLSYVLKTYNLKNL